jgi:hypothetical protein
LLRTTTASWSQVRAVRSEVISYGDEQIVIDLDDGRVLWAPVRCRSAFRGRRSSIGGPYLPADEYDAAVHRLESAAAGGA